LSNEREIEMLKSRIYELAQKAVVESEVLLPYQKLEVLRELMSREDLEKYLEKKDTKKESEVAENV
jgi:hypothetical protein